MKSTMHTSVQSVYTLPYKVIADTSFHPALVTGAQTRIYGSLTNKRHAAILLHALVHPFAKYTGTIILQEATKPVYVIQNLASYAMRSHALVVRCDKHESNSWFECIDTLIVLIAIVICVNSITSITSLDLCKR